jgi:hypothetical protein
MELKTAELSAGFLKPPKEETPIFSSLEINRFFIPCEFRTYVTQHRKRAWRNMKILNHFSRGTRKFIH